MSGPERAVPAFDAVARNYDGCYDDPGPRGHWIRSRMAAALGLLGDGPGDVLDVGMGAGRLCAELDRRGWTVWGVDGSEEMVSLARARIPDASERLLQGLAERLPFGDATFDAVVATGVIGYVSDRGQVLREIARVLRPGGRAVVASGNAVAPYRVWRHHVFWPLGGALAHRGTPGPQPPAVPRSRPFTRRGLTALLARAGLLVETVDYAGFAVVLEPLDRVFPRTSVRLARALGGRRSPVRRLAGTQLLVAARKPQAQEDRPTSA